MSSSSYAQRCMDSSIESASPALLAELVDHPNIALRQAALRHPSLPTEIFYNRLHRLDSTAIWDNPLVALEMISGKPLDGLCKAYRTLSNVGDETAEVYANLPGVSSLLGWMLKWWNSRSLPELVRFSAQHVHWRSTRRDFFPCVDMLSMGHIPPFTDRERGEKAAKAREIVQARMAPNDDAMNFLRDFLASCQEWETGPDTPWAHWLRALSKCTNAFRYGTDALPDKAMEVTGHLIAAGYNLTEDTFRARFPYPPANCKEILWPTPPAPLLEP